MIYLVKNQSKDFFALKKCKNLRSANFYIESFDYKIISFAKYVKFWIKQNIF